MVLGEVKCSGLIDKIPEASDGATSGIGEDDDCSLGAAKEFGDEAATIVGSGVDVSWSCMVGISTGLKRSGCKDDKLLLRVSASDSSCNSPIWGRRGGVPSVVDGQTDVI